MVNHSVPVMVRGVLYPSIRATAAALGVEPGTVSNALARGEADNIGLGRNCWRVTPIRVNGVRYESFTLAAKAIGLPVQAFRGSACWRRKRGDLVYTYKGFTCEILPKPEKPLLSPAIQHSVE